MNIKNINLGVEISMKTHLVSSIIAFALLTACTGDTESHPTGLQVSVANNDGTSSGSTGGDTSGGTSSGSTGGDTSGGTSSGSTGGDTSSGSSGGTSSGSTGGDTSGGTSSGSTGGDTSGGTSSGSTGGDTSGGTSSGSTSSGSTGGDTSGGTSSGSTGGDTSGGTSSGSTSSGSTGGDTSGGTSSGSTGGGTSSGSSTGGDTSSGSSTGGDTSGGSSGGTSSGSSGGTSSGGTSSSGSDSDIGHSTGDSSGGTPPVTLPPPPAPPPPTPPSGSSTGGDTSGGSSGGTSSGSSGGTSSGSEAPGAEHPDTPPPPSVTAKADCSAVYTGTESDWISVKEVITLEEGVDTDLVSGLDFNTKGTKLISGSWDNVIRIWDINSSTPIETISAHTGRIKSVDLSPNDVSLATIAYNSDFTIHDLFIDTELRTKATVVPGVNGLKISYNNDGTKLVTALWNEVKIWDVRDLSHVKTFDSFERTTATYSNDGTKLAIASFDGTVKIWDMNNLDNDLPILELKHDLRVRSVAFSPSGNKIAVGLEVYRTKEAAKEAGEPYVADFATRGSIIVWDLEKVYYTSNTNVSTCLTGHTHVIRSLAFADENKLISGSWDNSVKIWNISDIENISIKTLYGNGEDATDKYVEALTFNDHSKLLAAGFNNIIKIWRLSYK